MAIRIMSPLPARIIQVLQDYLETELGLIDTEESDGITTPVIADADYHAWDTHVIAETPACTIRTVSSLPVEVYPALHGSRIYTDNRIDVMFHATTNDTDGDTLTLQKLMHRYIAGGARVLAMKYERLQTSADPTDFVEVVEWREAATYGPESEQEDGSLVRTATLPLTVRQFEAA